MEEMFAIVCDDDEGALLSNKHSLELWTALETLLKILSEDSSLALSKDAISSWKLPHKHSSAKEAYGWRAILEEIKDNDLFKKVENELGQFSSSNEDVDSKVLMTDKPAMLKLAGEITNALLHSYNYGHKITFSRTVHSESSE